MNALMIDIETLGLIPGSAITQVGYCAANLRTGEQLFMPVNIYVEAHPSMIDMDTVAWWMRQSEAARNAVFPEHVTRVAPARVFEILQDVYRELGGAEAGVTVWASPAMFDLPMLTSMFATANKSLRDAKPWPYYMERDLMTLYKMLDPEKKLKPTNPVEHDAASDAKAQMDHLIAIFQANPQILEGAK